MKAFLVVVALAALQFLLRPESDLSGRRELHESFPEAVHTVLLGGFRPLLVQALWWQLEAAYDAGDYVRVMNLLRLLEQADRSNARAATYLARFLAFDLAPREDRGADRVALIREALDLIERTQHRVRDPHLALVRGLILQGPWTGDPLLRREFERREGMTPTEAAVAAYRQGLELAPDAVTLRLLLAEALRELALQLTSSGRIEAGVASLDEAARVLESIPERQAGVLPGLHRAWREMLGGLERKDPKAVQQGLEKLYAELAALGAPSRSTAEDGFARALLHVLIQEKPDAWPSARPVDVLSLLEAGHRILALLDERVDREQGEVRVDASLHEALRAAVERVLLEAPELRDRVPASLKSSVR